MFVPLKNMLLYRHIPDVEDIQKLFFVKELGNDHLNRLLENQRPAVTFFG